MSGNFELSGPFYDESANIDYHTPSDHFQKHLKLVIETRVKMLI